MDQASKKSSSIEEVAWFAIFLLFIFLAAIIRDFFLLPLTGPHPSDLGMLVRPTWKLATWLVPSFFYIRYVEKQPILVYLKLNRNIGRGVFIGIGISILLALVIVPVRMMHGISFHPGIPADTWLNDIVLVGFMEEIPFRGVVFQKLDQWLGLHIGALVSALIFMGIHVPLWIATGQFTLSACLSVLAVGYGLCYLYTFSRSLWSTIIVHDVYDFFSFTVL